MSKALLTSLALAVVLAAGCQSLNVITADTRPRHADVPADSGVTVTRAQEDKYESAPDTSGAEILSTGSAQSSGAGAALSSDEYQGSLISDATMSEPVNGNGATMSDQLETAPVSQNARLGAAEPYSNFSETTVVNDYSDLLTTNYGNNQSGVSSTAPVHGSDRISADAPQGAASNYQSGQLSINEARDNISGACSATLHNEASGIARTLIKELAARLRTEQGSIYVAPTIIDREYEECVSDLSSAIQDGLVGSASFQIVPATTNISNIISQNIGSATILPTMIHQCRASDIPYLVVSQIRKTGDKAALTLRIIRTEDGITLGQTYRRLSQ